MDTSTSTNRGSFNNSYCKIPGCSAVFRPSLDIESHVNQVHPDLLIKGSICEINVKLNLIGSDTTEKRLMIAHDRKIWITLHYSYKEMRMVCKSDILDEDADMFPTHSVSVFLSGFGHEVLLNQNFGSKRDKNNRPLNDPVSSQELSMMINSNKIINAVIQIVRRPARPKKTVTDKPKKKKKYPSKKKKTAPTSLSELSKVAQPHEYCVIINCGINIDFIEMLLHFKIQHPDLIINGSFGDMSLTLQLDKRNTLLIKLISTMGEIFFVMVAYWYREKQLQFGSFMKCNPVNQKYSTHFKMSKRSAVVGQTLFEKLLGGHLISPLKEETCIVLTGEKIKDMVDSEGLLEVQVRVKIDIWQDDF